MTRTEITRDYRAAVVALQRRLALALAVAWDHVSINSLDASWPSFLAYAVTTTANLQTTAATLGSTYVTDLVTAAGLTPLQQALAAASFSGRTSVGAPLTSVYTIAGLIDVKQRIALGMPPRKAMAASYVRMARIAKTETADAARGAVNATMAIDPRITGYVRQVRLPSCARCLILAGKEYAWNDGFARHPLCDCYHVPIIGGATPDTVDVHQVFNDMTAAEQDRVFSPAGAEAIRTGADPASVVNVVDAKAGMTTPGGATLVGTTTRSLSGKRLAEIAGTEKRGGRRTARAARLTPQTLLDHYGEDRDRYIAALYRHGYIVTRTSEVAAAIERTAV